MSLLDKKVIDLPCPNCGRKHPKEIGWIKANRELACDCGGRIRLDADKFVREIREVEEALKRLPKWVR